MKKKIIILLITFVIIIFIKLLYLNYNVKLYDNLGENIVFSPEMEKFETKKIHEGFSNFEKSYKKLIETRKMSNKDILILSYFDLKHPLVLLIYNMNEKKQIRYSSSINELDHGLTIVRFYRYFKGFEIETNLKQQEYIIDQNIGSYDIYKKSIDKNNFGGTHVDGTLPSFIYMSMVYIPLFILLILFTKKKYSLFLFIIYYLEMLILFGVKNILINSYLLFFSYTNKSLGYFILLFLFLVLILLSLYGLYRIRHEGKKLSYFDKMIVLFFILLPFVLKI